MKLLSYGKFIDTASIGNVLVQGEKNADNVVFELSRYYDGYDISELVFIISGVNSKSQLAETVLSKEVLSDKIILNWCIGAEFTAESGIMKLELRGVAASEDESTSDTIIKFSMPPVNIRKSEYCENYPSPDVIENAVDRIHIIENNINSVYSSVTSAIMKTPYISDGVWFVYDYEAGKYVNTGVSACENSRICDMTADENLCLDISMENNTEYRCNTALKSLNISGGNSFNDGNFISSVVFRCSDNCAVNIDFDFTYIYEMPLFTSGKQYCMIFFEDGFGTKCLWYEV